MRSLPVAALLASCILGCAAMDQRPVLYPNAKLKQVGDAAAQRDIDECSALADKSGASRGSSQAMRGGVEGAAVGAATAAVGTLIGGGNLGERAAAGAAIGGTAGAVSGAFRRGEGSSVFRSFVQRCLSERGYEVIGWNEK
jgi:outer membrane lipoprotein SlyB